MDKIVHQILISDSHKESPKNLESVKQCFKGYEHIVWNYKKIKAFILKNGDSHVLHAIDSVRPYAYKADIARYYILYKFGGWYSDCSIFFNTPPRYEKYSFVFFRDVQKNTGTSWAVANGLFYSNKNNSVLQKSIDMCIESVKDQYYGANALCPTGPALFGSAIASERIYKNSNYLIGDLIKGEEPGFYFEDTLFAKYKPGMSEEDDYQILGGNYYPEMWNKKGVY